MTAPDVPSAQTGDDTGSQDDAPPPPPPATGGDSSRDRLTRTLAVLAKVLGVVVTLVTLAGGAVTLLFQVDPTLEPCIGSSGATFTAIQIFAGYPYTQYAADLGFTPSDYAATPGVEVRFNYTLDNLSGANPVLRGTLQQVAPDGHITAPRLPGFLAQIYLMLNNQTTGDALRKFASPTRCSQDGNGIYWMSLEPGVVPTHHSYRIVLELYNGHRLTDRIGVGVTPVFDH